MFAFRLWRRVHRPFLLIIFTVSTLLFLTNVSVVSTTGQVLSSPAESSFESDVLPSLDSEQRLKGRMIVNDEDSDEEEGAEMKVELGLEEDLVPVPEMKQLPFCDNAKSRGHQGSSGATKSTSATSSAPEGLWGTKDNETSGVKDDEDMLVNSNGLSSGKHILVATLDGQLTLLDYTGKLVWSFCTGHLFSSTISSLQLNDRGKYIKLIPSLTGALYSYDGESLQAMPLNAESLLRKSFKLSQDVVITGGKELRTFGVDVDSGNIKYECGMDGCKSPTTATADLTSKEDGSGVVLVIKKQLQTVRAIDSATGTERWNFSVGTHELGLAGVTEGCYEPSEEDLPGNEEPMPLFRMVIPEGVVDGFDTENKIRWRHKFESPITQAWTLENNRLKIVDPIKTSPLLHESPSLYVGIHKKQLYVQESLSTLKKLQGLYELEGAGNTSNGEQLQIGWKPSSSPAVIEHDPEPEPELAIVPQGSTALAPLHITPFFVYERDQINHPAIEAPPNNSDSDNLCLDGDEEEFEEVGGNHSGVDNEVLLSLATLWFWWKEVLGISLVTAIILNILLMRPMAHFVRRRAIEDVMYQVNAFLRRRREAVLALPAPPSPSSTDSLEVPPSVRNRTVSTSSTQSLLDEPNQTIVFMSQYLNEFEPIECLGRGAFGTVFEARKKIDEQSYAVKRIPLPNREKSRVRVMREVKALAKLDHKNIVRYFNAWIESPPHGWLEKHDPLWNCRTLISPTATYDNSGVGSGDYTSIPSFFAHRKKDYSAILVADKTPDENDSFIVFETGSAPPDEGGSLDSGANLHSKIWNKNQRPSMIEELDDDTDESGSNSNSNRSSSIIPEPEVINSKFFRRPTTLNMPSSTDTSENNNCVVVPSQDGKDGCPPSIMYLYIQQELCQKRTLQDWLRTSRTRKLRQILLMFSQIVEAVEYIHSNNLIHRDLKPSNIFLAGRNGADKEDIHDMTVKIGDFGLATTLVANDSTDEFSEGFDIDLQPGNAKLTGQVGTHLYMSPEQKLHNKAYDHKVDIYSLGLIFFELIVPLCTDMERHNELTRARKLEFPKDFTLSYSDQHDLIRSMLSPDPDLRPDASDIKISLSNQLQKVPTFDPMQSRSKSYPSNLTGSQTKRQRLPEDENKDKKPQGSRRIYKTHSAM